MRKRFKRCIIFPVKGLFFMDFMIRDKGEESMSKKPVVLMILDGYGLNSKAEGNAVAQKRPLWTN